jgi:hypothetical protein
MWYLELLAVIVFFVWCCLPDVDSEFEGNEDEWRRFTDGV